MPASAILRIMVTTGTIQFLCDIAAHFFIYSKESYHDAVDRAQRAEASVAFWKQKQQNKHANRIVQAEEEAAERAAYVSRFHIWPQLWVAVAFLLVTRILGTEMGQQVTAVLPFAPPQWMRRWITARGLEWESSPIFEPSPGSNVTDLGQACSWTLIYVLSAMSIKFYVSKVFGNKSPLDSNILMKIAETKQGKKMLKSAGIDPNDLKELKGE